MKQLRTLRHWWRDQKEGFKELWHDSQVKYMLQQMAFGAMLGACLLLLCGIGGWLENCCN